MDKNNNNKYERTKKKPESIKELRKQLAIRTVPNHGLVELYRRYK